MSRKRTPHRSAPPGGDDARPPKAPPAGVVRAVEGAVNLLEGLQNRMVPAPVALSRMLADVMVLSQCIYVAAELRVADHIAAAEGGVIDVASLARAVSAHEDALYRVLRMLAGNGIFAEEGERRFRLTRLGDCLRDGAPDSLAAWARFLGAGWNMRTWAGFLDSVKNGRTVYENQFGRRVFEVYAEHPDWAATFDAAMSDMSRLANGAIAAAVRLGGAKTLVDVAGGQGSLLAMILRANPEVKGTLFDQPRTIERARAAGLADAEGLAGRLSLEPGDLFERVPAGHDAYLLKWILHDWTDEEAVRILRVVREAAGAPDRRLFVVEMLIEPGNRPSPAKVLDISMLAMTGGRERTEAEYGALLAAAGFRLVRTVPTASPYSVLEAVST